MSILAIRASGDNGGVYSGDDDPNSATTGTAMCPYCGTRYELEGGPVKHGH